MEVEDNDALYFGIDPTYILVIIGIAISGAASAYVNSTFRKYDQVRSSKHVTGTQRQYILQKNKLMMLEFSKLRVI